MTESKRVRNLRLSIVKAIPKFPNNKETKDELEAMSLSQLLIHYFSWAYRSVSIRPREVEIEPTALKDKRWGSLKGKIDALLEKVRNGEDLTPHLSLQAHSRGYTPAASATGPNVDRWADKDFLLNAIGYHHFHLGERIESGGFATRTDEVVFARVTREKFTVVAIFDHSVFEPIGSEMNAERKRLWSIFDEHVTRGAPSGSVIISSPIATSGHPIHLVSMAQEYSWVVREMDPKFEDREFVTSLYVDAGLEEPKNPKLEWRLNFTDLGIYEKNHKFFFVLRRGCN